MFYTIRRVPRRWLVVFVAVVFVGLPAGAEASGDAVSQPPSACVSSQVCTSWRSVDRWAGQPAPVYTTTLTTAHATLYVEWIRAGRTQLALYPGYEGPGPSTVARGPEAVPGYARNRLLATFNSGFYEKDAPGGFYAHGTLYYPMIKGLATIEQFRDGHFALEAWTGARRPPPDVVMARQNLRLLMNNQQIATTAKDNAQWGLTLGGAPAVWRSALAIDASGNLLYLAAPSQTALSLAENLARFHVVTAMELDINPEWPIFVTYGGSGAQRPHLEVPNSNQIPTRFLSTSTKDFFAVFLAKQPGSMQPW